MKTSAGLVYLLATLLEPFMPSFSTEVNHKCNVKLFIQLFLSYIFHRKNFKLTTYDARNHLLISPMCCGFLGFVNQKVLKQLNLPQTTHFSLEEENRERPWEMMESGHKIGIPKPLFKELV